MMTTIGLQLIWCILQLTLFLSIGCLIDLFLSRRNPRLALGVASSFLVLSLPLTIQAFLPLPGIIMTTGIQQVPAAQAGMASSDQDRQIRSPDKTWLEPSVEPVASVNESVIRSGLWRDWIRHTMNLLAPLAAEPVTARQQQWPVVIATALLTTSSFALMWLTVGLIQLWRLLNRSHSLHDHRVMIVIAELATRFAPRRPITVYESNEIDSAATVGWLRPIILLPTQWRDWTDTELRMVVAHEVSHVCHADYVVWLLARLAVALHFYHPLIHWLMTRLHLQQELRADAEAAQVALNPQDYLKVLAQMSLQQDDRRINRWARAFLPARNMLSRRIEMLRSTDASSCRPRRVLSGVIAILAIAAAGGIAALRIQADDTSQQSIASAGQTDNDNSPRKPLKVMKVGSFHSKEPLQFENVGCFRVRPAKLLAREEAQSLIPFADVFVTSILGELGSDKVQSHVTAVEEVTGTVSHTFRRPDDSNSKDMIACVLETLKVVDSVDLLPALQQYYPSAQARDGRHARVFQINTEDFRNSPMFRHDQDHEVNSLVEIAPGTLVCVGMSPESAEKYQSGEKHWKPCYAEHPLWSRVDGGLFTFALSLSHWANSKEEPQGPVDVALWQVISHSTQLAGSVDYDQNLSMSLIIEVKTEADAPAVESAIRDLLVLFKEFLDDLTTPSFKAVAQQFDGMAEGVQLLHDLREGIRVTTKGTEIHVSTQAPFPLQRIAKLLDHLPKTIEEAIDDSTN